MSADTAIAPISAGAASRDGPGAPRLPEASAAPVEAAIPPAPAPAANATPSFPVTLQFDAATHRLIIEARDPSSGFVVLQMPPRSAVKRLAAGSTGSPAASRGNRFDRTL